MSAIDRELNEILNSTSTSRESHNEMSIVQRGNHVLIRYTTFAADGGVIETSGERYPLRFIAGSSDVIPGVSRAVIGMSVGEKRRIAVAPEQAFGQRDARLQQSVSKAGIFDKVDEGDQLTATVNGIPLDIWVKSISDREILLDGNHPLAGESLVYEIEVVEVSH